VGYCGIFKYFSGFEFFVLTNRISVRPRATYANYWTVDDL